MAQSDKKTSPELILPRPCSRSLATRTNEWEHFLYGVGLDCDY